LIIEPSIISPIIHHLSPLILAIADSTYGGAYFQEFIAVLKNGEPATVAAMLTIRI
jgi:hypothetical protein